MNRRDFVAGSLGASIMPVMGQAEPGGGGAAEGPPSTTRAQVLELRRYQFRFGPMAARHAEYAKTALLPALNRAGIQPVGAFWVSVGPDSPAVYLLLPHPDAGSVLSLAGRLGADAEYQRAGASFRSLPASDPPYVRRDSWLMAAFETTPSIEKPSGPLAAPSRVFELRTYESHNERAGLKKIEMFEKAGEIPIFRRVGITPVFFGRNVVGSGLPSLTYLTVFADMTARSKAWAAFGEDPEWVKLRETAGFSNSEILSNIDIQLLRPTDYSQL